MSFRRLTLAALCATAAIVLFTGTACAQSREMPLPSRGWIVADALGFGSLGLITGAAMGAAASAGSDCGFGPCAGAALMAMGGALVGAAGGAALGVRARKAAAEGRPITRAHHSAMTVGGVLGGFTLGAVASSVLINPEGAGTPIGSDELTFFTLTGAGGLIGSWFVISHRNQLDRITVKMTPSVAPKRYGLNAQLTF